MGRETESRWWLSRKGGKGETARGEGIGSKKRESRERSGEGSRGRRGSQRKASHFTLA